MHAPLSEATKVLVNSSDLVFWGKKNNVKANFALIATKEFGSNQDHVLWPLFRLTDKGLRPTEPKSN